MRSADAGVSLACRSYVQQVVFALENGTLSYACAQNANERHAVVVRRVNAEFAVARQPASLITITGALDLLQLKVCSTFGLNVLVCGRPLATHDVSATRSQDHGRAACAPISTATNHTGAEHYCGLYVLFETLRMNVMTL